MFSGYLAVSAANWMHVAISTEALAEEAPCKMRGEVTMHGKKLGAVIACFGVGVGVFVSREM